MKNRSNFCTTALACLILGCMMLSACTSEANPASTRAASTSIGTKPAAVQNPTVVPAAATTIALPRLSLQPGEYYFRLNGQPSLLFSRNLGGGEEDDYYNFLDWSVSGGSRIVRIPLECFGMGFDANGEINEAWAEKWEHVFDHAAADGIYVIPILAGWIQWNNGSGASSWASNPMNAANGGPARDPLEFFQAGSTTQIRYLSWMEKLVKRWKDRPNILAWEIFSEVNMTPTTESDGTAFVNTAAARIRAADPSGRLITASLANSGTWPDFYARANIDFIQTHPYPVSGQLDRDLVMWVHKLLAAYLRPVMIGESGISAATPDSSSGNLIVAKNAEHGIRHAIWAGVVSGAMNARALWWEDGFGIYFRPALGMAWLRQYSTEEQPAANFTSGVDFSGFKPIQSTPSPAIWGAVVGNDSRMLGWFRDAASEPPDWKVQTLSGQSVILNPPGSAATWKVDFYDTTSGTKIIASTQVSRSGNGLMIKLPAFTDDIAFKMTAVAGN